MKIHVRRWIETLRSSYWFIPLVFCGASVVLATVLTTVDLRITPTFDGLEWLRPSQPTGARALLSTIAGSTITVAGVAFSVTLVALATAAGTFGPRLLSLFLTDRGVQTSLGMFCATFLYCLLVLRLVGSAAEGGEDFVPQAAVLGAITMALLTLGFFIYFVHHIAQSMLVDNVISRTAQRLDRALDGLPQGDVQFAEEPHHFGDAAVFVRVQQSGYVIPPDRDRLVEVARAEDTIIEVLCPVGAFVSTGAVVARLGRGEPTAGTMDDLRSALAVSHRRRAIEDPDYYIDQLVQIAARALSPGVNDPFTAITSIHALEGVLARLGTTMEPWLGRTDSDGVLRLVWRRAVFVDRFRSTLGAIRPYAQSDPIARHHLIRAFERLLERAVAPAAVRAIQKELDLLTEVHLADRAASA